MGRAAKKNPQESFGYHAYAPVEHKPKSTPQPNPSLFNQDEHSEHTQ